MNLEDCPELEDLWNLPEDQRFAEVLRYLTAKKARLIGFAMAILIHQGPGIVRRLVQEAAMQRRRPALQTRLLEVIEKIGAPLEVDSFMDITFMASHGYPRVRQQAAQTIYRLSPGGRSNIKTAG